MPGVGRAPVHNSAKPIPPSAPAALDTYTPVQVNVNAATAVGLSSSGQQVLDAIQSGQTTNKVDLNNILAANGVDFSPQQNPLNAYANYTYHIRFFMTSEISAYNDLDTSNPNADSLGNKTIIAESGVTAGFNIVDFELKNTCGPNSKTQNTTNTGWTMTVVEPFGMSFIDKIRSSAITQPIINYSRAPYFIDVWFTGYDEDGNVIADKVFYQLYRVQIIDIDVKMTEASSIYTVTGIMDGNLGHSNEISIPPAGLEIKATTIGDFFSTLATKLNDQQKTVNDQNFAIVEYKFNVPSEIQQWQLKAADSDKQNERQSDMDLAYQNGTIKFKTDRGTSIDNIVNYILSISPQVDAWVKGSNGGSSDLKTKGLAKWIMVHSAVKITGWDAFTGDYIREVTYSLVPYTTVRVSGDVDTANALQQKQVQIAKLQELVSSNSLIKQYNYIYTGKNTEVIRFDIHIENLFSITLPQWEATNSYNNYTQGPLFADSVGDQKSQGKYTKQQLISNLQGQAQKIDAQVAANSATLSERQTDRLIEQSDALKSQAALIRQQQNSNIKFTANTKSTGELAVDQSLLKNQNVAQQLAVYSTLASQNKANRYAEEVKNVPAGLDPFPIVTRQTNEPTAQRAERGADSNKAMPTKGATQAPSSRAFVGSILGNMFDPQFFSSIELEIRGDPYWMGQSNIREDLIATTLAESSVDSNYANYVVSDHMFILSFTSGDNYDEDTGLMNLGSPSLVFNGAYAVLEVTNSFKGGSFTQMLSAYKDPFAQKVNNETGSATSSATPSTPTAAPAPAAPSSGAPSIYQDTPAGALG